MPTNNLKHVGQIVNTQRRCVVVFREIPGDENHCLIVDTDSLVDWMHDDVINAVQSHEGQKEPEFYQYAARAMFTDGTPMLNTMHRRGLLKKQPTTNISMTPNRETSILLSELNKLIREQNGGKPVVQDAADNKPLVQEAPATVNDADMAQSLLSQADVFEKEAANLREQAYEMDPSLKPKAKRTKKVADKATV